MELRIKKDSPVYPNHKHWQFCVGSGHASLAMRSDYARQLKFIHDELGIRYVRFHGILNDDMGTLNNFSAVMPIPGCDKFTERTFYRCGLAYDNVLAAGMKPFVELSFMPNLLANNPPGTGFGNSNMNLPKDFDAWADYIKAFARFLIHRYGKEEVESWFFEVWNEPDLAGVFFNGTQTDYFKLYEVTARALKEVNEKLRVGGPSTSGSKWIARFAAFCKENNVPLDFLTTHQYAGDPLGGIEDEGGPDKAEEENSNAAMEEMKSRFMGVNPFEGLSSDASLLDVLRRIFQDESEAKDLQDDVFRKNAAVVKKQAQGLPVYYTEWNFSATFSAYSNDTRKAAAYDIKTSLNISENVDGSSVWCFSDIFEELHQFPQEFHGGFGMQTLNGIPKPTFYGFKMLAQTAENRIDLGESATENEIGAAAFKNEKETQILLFRFKMKNAALPKERSEMFIEAPKIPSKIILQRIDEDHCNPLKLWENEGKPADLTPAEVKAYIERSKLYDEDIPFTYEDGNICLSVDLGVNDICFIRIIM